MSRCIVEVENNIYAALINRRELVVNRPTLQSRTKRETDVVHKGVYKLYDTVLAYITLDNAIILVDPDTLAPIVQTALTKHRIRALRSLAELDSRVVYNLPLKEFHDVIETRNFIAASTTFPPP